MQERYEPKDLESKWQKYWTDSQIYQVTEDISRPKYYCLDMFPYPSGAGLHVGHPRGYVASDVFSRTKRMQGFNVLHPMGFDSFGLPAEQYAISTGNNPGPFTEELIVRFREQLRMIGMSYDWSREIATHRPDFYKWTQWIFLKLFGYYYDTGVGKALPITDLVSAFQVAGSAGVSAAHTPHSPFTADEWNTMSDLDKQAILMSYRIAYEGYAEVNWCSEMGTVLANDEIITDDSGRMVSERGGFLVEKKSMRQWFMRITAYADRLLAGLESLDWSESIKMIQRNWIGKSEGAEIDFDIIVPYSDTQSISGEVRKVVVFTTRADTLFGVTYIVLAPEHALVAELLSLISNRSEVEEYIDYVRNRSEDDRVAGKEKTGVQLSGVYAVNPANNEQVPVWISDYVLASYGTGAVMAVPAHDERDWEFAQKFGLPVRHVIEQLDINTGPGNDAYREGVPEVERSNVVCIIEHPTEDMYLCSVWKQVHWNGFVTGGIDDGVSIEDSARTEVVEETGYTDIASMTVLDSSTHGLFYHVVKNTNRFAHYRIVHIKLGSLDCTETSDHEQAIADHVWKPASEIAGFLTRSDMRYAWQAYRRELNCMTGKGVLSHSGEYTHLRSSEAIQKMVERGVARSRITYRMRDAIFARQRYWGEPIPLRYDSEGIVSALADSELPLRLPALTEYLPTPDGQPPLARDFAWIDSGFETNTMPGWAGSSWYWLRYMDPHNESELASRQRINYWKNVDMYVGGREHATGHLLYSRFWNLFLYDIGIAVTPEPFQSMRNQGMILASDGRKMSKRWGNTVTPDEMVERFGADAFRLYQCFIGPFDASQPWIIDGLVGCRRFLERVWRIVIKASNSNVETSELALKSLHRTIKKVGEDILEFKFNTAVSSMMECINVLDRENVSVSDIRSLLIILAPCAPHMTEELYQSLPNPMTSIHLESWPSYSSEYLVDTVITIALSINGKPRGELEIPVDATEEEVCALAQSTDVYTRWVGESAIRKTIFVPNKIINFIL